QPDLVLLQMFPLNDIVNNGRDFAGDNESDGDYMRPYFVVGPDGALQRADRHPLRSLLRRHSLLFAHLEFDALSLRAERWRREGPLRNARVRQSHVARGEFPLLESRILVAEPQSEAWESAWRVTHALLHEINQTVHAAGADLVVALIPCREEYSEAALQDR